MIERGGDIIEVPSQSSSKYYAVNLARLTCECPDYRKRRAVCKHIEAARIYRTNVKVDGDGHIPLPSAHRNAPWYDALKENEINIFLLLLKSLVIRLHDKETVNA